MAEIQLARLFGMPHQAEIYMLLHEIDTILIREYTAWSVTTSRFTMQALSRALDEIRRLREVCIETADEPRATVVKFYRSINTIPEGLVHRLTQNTIHRPLSARAACMWWILYPDDPFVDDWRKVVTAIRIRLGKMFYLLFMLAERYDILPISVKEDFASEFML